CLVPPQDPRPRVRGGARFTGSGAQARGAVHQWPRVPSACHRWRGEGPRRRVLVVPPSSRGREPLTFAEQLDRLEEIVRRLESQDLNVDLDEALKLFEEGVERLREARERLTAAEAQVKQVLADRAGNFKVEDFDA